MDYCFAVREGSTTLYSILSKIIGQVPGAAVNASLTYYSSETPRTGLIGYIVDHPLIAALAVFCVTQLLIVLILLRRFSPSKKSGEKAPRAPEQT